MQIGNIFENTEFGPGDTNIDQPATVFPGATLTIKAGAHILSKATITVKGATKEDGSRVFGVLIVQGSANNPVLFTGPLSTNENG